MSRIEISTLIANAKLPVALIEDLDKPDRWRRRGARWVFEETGETPTSFTHLTPCVQCCPPKGAVLRLQMGARTPLCDVGWSGDWNRLARRRRRAPGARVDVDHLRIEKPATQWNLRLAAEGESPWKWKWGVASVTWRGEGKHRLWKTAPKLSRRVEIRVPRCSQMAEGGRRGSEACSAATIQMLLAHRRVKRPLPRIMRDVLDPLENIYGNWQRSVEAAWRFGRPGLLCHFRHWEQVLACLCAGVPIGASIRFPRGKVHLPGAPIGHSAGHLVVLRGLAPAGQVIVNDPAAKTRSGVSRHYPLEAFSRAWLGFSGMGYLVL